MSKKNKFTKKPEEISINTDTKIYLKKPKMTFMIKYLGDIQQIPEILSSGARIEKEAEKVANVIEKILSYAIVDEKGQRIIGNNEGQIPFDDFDPDADWELLKAQGIEQVFQGDFAFSVFFYLMKEIGQFRSIEKGEEVKTFPDEPTGD